MSGTKLTSNRALVNTRFLSSIYLNWSTGSASTNRAGFAGRTLKFTAVIHTGTSTRQQQWVLNNEGIFFSTTTTTKLLPPLRGSRCVGRVVISYFYYYRWCRKGLRRNTLCALVNFPLVSFFSLHYKQLSTNE